MAPAWMKSIRVGECNLGIVNSDHGDQRSTFYPVYKRAGASDKHDGALDYWTVHDDY